MLKYVHTRLNLTSTSNFFDLNKLIHLQVDTDSEEEEGVEEDEDERAKKWLTGLKTSSSQTAKEILKIRKGTFALQFI